MPSQRGDDAESQMAQIREGLARARQQGGMGPPDWQEKPNVWVAWAAQRMQEALPKKMADRCMAAGIIVGADGKWYPVTAISGFTAGVPKAVRDVVPGIQATLADIPGESMHAEMRLLLHARRTGGQLIIAGAGFPVCDPCVDALDSKDVKIATRVQHPERERPYRRDTSAGPDDDDPGHFPSGGERPRKPRGPKR